VNRALARDGRERELRARFDVLTKRELEVLGHVVLGRLNKQIAADLCIHERTLKLHRTAIYDETARAIRCGTHATGRRSGHLHAV
jgi:FixJ family two-component response regulator